MHTIGSGSNATSSSGSHILTFSYNIEYEKLILWVMVIILQTAAAPCQGGQERMNESDTWKDCGQYLGDIKIV